MHDPMKIDLAPATLREMATDRLRAAIIAGRYASGARLIERVLCDQLGVSRSVVREAIRYLEAEGLVEITPRVGPIVAPLDGQSAAQIYAIRRLLESAAAADCAARADAATKAALQTACQQLEIADSAAIYRASTMFYQIIFQSAGHDIAWDVVQRLNSRISRLRVLTLTATDRKIPGPAHMARICAAICANDPQAAVKAVQDHLDDAAQIAKKLLEDP